MALCSGWYVWWDLDWWVHRWRDYCIYYIISSWTDLRDSWRAPCAPQWYSQWLSCRGHKENSEVRPWLLLVQKHRYCHRNIMRDLHGFSTTGWSRTWWMCILTRGLGRAGEILLSFGEGWHTARWNCPVSVVGLNLIYIIRIQFQVSCTFQPIVHFKKYWDC